MILTFDLGNSDLVVGAFKDDELVAIMDLIVNYQKNNTCYIGLFMIDIEKQNRGIGSKIINELFVYLYNKGFQGVELGYVEQNMQAKRFWLKNGFEIIGSQQQELFNVICMRKVLNGSGKNEWNRDNRVNKTVINWEITTYGKLPRKAYK